MRPDVIVIGLGAVGAATLYQLAKRGVRALGVDRFSPPHDQGSSHGQTRITRQGIGEGDDYVPLALRAHQIWRELEARTGEQLLRTCGLAIIASSDGKSLHHGKTDFLSLSQGAAERFGIAHEVISRAEAGYRYPQFALADGEIMYVEPGAGAVFPERCIAAQLSEARRLGARIVTGRRVTSLDDTADGVRVETDEGVLEAGQAIVTAGAWTPALTGAGLGKLTIQPQAVHWFDAANPSDYAPDRCPVFIWMHGAAAQDSFYGFPIFPDAPTASVKVATEGFDTLPTPEALDREVAPRLAATIYDEHIAGRLVGVRPGALRSIACLYTMAPDADFVIGRSPDSDRILVASACSGHGFKHSAAVGELLTQLAESPSSEPPRAFRLDRFTPGLGDHPFGAVAKANQRVSGG